MPTRTTTKKKTTTKKRTVKKPTAPKTPRKRSPKTSSPSEKATSGDVSCQLYRGAEGIDMELAKSMIGWTVVEGDDYLLKDLDGKKIQCRNNANNRPLTKSNYEMLMGEILGGRWKFNGDGPIIIGKSGNLLNGQHTLVAIILATQVWQKADEADDCRLLFSDPPTIDKLVVFGVDEDDATVNTMDTCKPRSVSDVIYRSSYFEEYNNQQRKTISKMAEHAVKYIWSRTGDGLEGFNARRSVTQTIEFIDDHKRVLEAVSHIFEEDDGGRVSKKYLSAGYASGLLYLMGTSASDQTKYRLAPVESSLSFEVWDKACDFWVELAGGIGSLKEIRSYLAELVDETGASRNERAAVLSKAWLLYADDKPIGRDDLLLEFIVEDDEKILTSRPSVGGIDLGVRVREPEVDPTPEEIRAAEKEIQKERSKTKGGPIETGENVYVVERGGGHWYGRVVEISGRVGRVKIAPGFVGAGKVEDVEIKNLSREKPADMDDE